MTPADGHSPATDMTIPTLRDNILPLLRAKIPADKIRWTPRADVAREAKAVVADYLAKQRLELNLLDQRDLVTSLVNGFLAEGGSAQPAPTAPPPAAPTADTRPPESLHAANAELDAPLISNRGIDPYARTVSSRSSVDQAKLKLQPIVLERIDTSAAAKMSRDDLGRDLTGLVAELLVETRIQLNASERQDLVAQLLNDMLGLGPLEPLLAEETISEIMVNGPKQVYIEQKGKLTLSDVQFRDNAHVLAIATRIVTAIGRRIDESTPLCDARLMDGSRVNIIIPPLAIDGPTITIRKFSKKKIMLDTMVKFGSMSQQMA
ncbi:MAG TPA: ATPase, T2SS/T4P/T4SS family, partial [Alphaproteobacteria bacterium]|nr:ATPase, T2SS/T4P/T4SS family [Alphaproteobacteria bacterium]